MQPLLTMRGVTKSFARGLARASRRTLAVTDIELDVFPGEIILISGDEGAGKTTLLQCASSLLRIDRGTVSKGRSSYVPAVPVYYPFLTVRDVLSLRGANKAHVEGLLTLLDLGNLASGIVANLSASALKRLAIAEALVTRPLLLLIDTSALEVPSSSTIAALASTDLAVVVAARNGSSLARIATRIVYLEDGRITRMFRTSHSLVAERMH